MKIKLNKFQLECYVYASRTGCLYVIVKYINGMYYHLVFIMHW